MDASSGEPAVAGGLHFHHCRPLEAVRFAVVKPRRREHISTHRASDECDWSDAVHQEILRDLTKSWLAARVGFWPMFLAVDGIDAVSLQTGYMQTHHSQQVLFSYSRLPVGVVLIDHLAFHEVIAATIRGPRVHGAPDLDDALEHAIFRRDLCLLDWLTLAAHDPNRVHALVPSLDLRIAPYVACHSEQVRQSLVALGFAAERVHDWHPVPPWARPAAQRITPTV